MRGDKDKKTGSAGNGAWSKKDLEGFKRKG